MAAEHAAMKTQITSIFDFFSLVLITAEQPPPCFSSLVSVNTPL